MDFESINSVNDLIDYNNSTSAKDKKNKEIQDQILELVTEFGPAAVTEIISDTLSHLIALHDRMADVGFDSGDKDSTIAWSEDSARLGVAKAIVDSVEF